eukprot:TRINITY_DN73584_c0_g1_i1.p1 TRINITY_DN73584_c0_g1~~TRINITY_DN73584_c0_g1_i1.p1  ORF type:complete len:919 (-),score=206.50 TRINITY_DN73584_c0_g1_i1:412-3168(-)
MTTKGTEGLRQSEIQYLQEQNRLVLESLERVEGERAEANELIRSCTEQDAHLQSELHALNDKIGAYTEQLNEDKKELTKKEDHLKVIQNQNNQMLHLLETEETKNKDYAESIRQLEAKIRKLQKVADAFDVAKAEIERKVSEAKSQCADVVTSVKSQRDLNESLRANIQNTEAKTRVDIEALGQALQVVDQKNIEYLSRINKQESREQQLKSETEALNEEVEKVRAEIDKYRKQLEGDNEGRTQFERARGQVEMTIQALEVQADTLKKALSTAERANEQLQEENRTAGERSRETADKVYALMDSLRLNQVELKKQEAENQSRDKKIISLERQIQNLQAKIAMETDAKVLAEQERKQADHESTVLKKKNKTIEDDVTKSQTAQEKAEKEIHEMNEKVSGLQTQNAYLASRIDGQEEEKNALRAEIKKIGDRTNELVSDNSRFRDEIDTYEENVATVHSDKEQLIKELEYIKREDLDEAGRQRPILIQSTESDLLEKLQVNEFLFEAQQARNPVPPLIEKVAQLLAMLHDGQQRADQYLADLSKSNGLVSALRQRNMALFSRTQMFESFKTRALLRYVMNLVEGDLMTDLHLDSLSFGGREINEMLNLLQRYEATDKVFVVSLIDNGLDEDSVNLLLQLVFQLPYLRSLNLKRNSIGPEGIRKMEEQLKTMMGVTTVIRTSEQVLNVHSGNQLRLCIDISEQMPKDMVAKQIDFTVHQDLAHADADPFLATNAGESQHPWQKSVGSQMRSTQQAVPEPSSVDLARPTGGPAAPVLGGPPVGLGGPGNVASLNRNKARPADGDPKRQARRAKGAPPPVLEHIPERVASMTARSGGFELPTSRPTSSQKLRAAVDQMSCISQQAVAKERKSSQRPSGDRKLERHPSQRSAGALPANPLADSRSVSMPTLRKTSQRRTLGKRT